MYNIIDFVLKEASGYDVRVTVRGQAEGLTRFANSEIHQNVFEDVTGVDIVVIEGKKLSRIVTTLYDEEGLRAAVGEAVENLKFLPESELIPPPASEPERIEADEFNEELAKAYDTERRALLVKDCLAMLEEDYLAYGALSYSEVQLALGNSTGIKRYVRANGVSFSALIAGEDGGSGYAEVFSNQLEDLDVKQIFHRSYEKAKMNKNAEQLEPGAYTVILEPLAVGELLTYMAFTGFSAKSVQNKASFLTGRKGQQVFDKRVTIVDDCTNPHTFKLPFDFEGYPRQKVTIIENGVAKDLVYDTLSAMKDGVETTGHSVDSPQMGGMPLNLVMEPGDQSLDEIIANTENGLLVTRFHYMNVVNPRTATLTALTRDGVFKVENGKIVRAVKNMRFTESMLQAFSNIEAISKERARTKTFFGNYYVPALKIRDFHFTGKTNA